MEEKRIKSVIPIYCLGGTFVLYSLTLPLHRITDLLIALGVSILMYFVASKVFPGKIVEVPRDINFTKSGDTEVDKMTTQGRAYIRRLQELETQIDDNNIQQQIRHLINISTQIFDFIAKNPAHARKLHSFMDYYYPQAMKFLENYAEFANKSVQGENIRTTLDKLSNGLSSIKEAFEHQLDNLFSDKAMDIRAEISVLENIMKREGVS